MTASYPETGGFWDVGVKKDGTDQLERHENKWRGTTIHTRKEKTYGFDLEQVEKLDQSYTQRRKPAMGGDRGSDDSKKTKGKQTVGYAKRVSERSVVCGIKEKGGKQERMENIEDKNLPNGRTLTTTNCKSTKKGSHGNHRYIVKHKVRDSRYVQVPRNMFDKQKHGHSRFSKACATSEI